jgi:hypothetical protein
MSKKMWLSGTGIIFLIAAGLLWAQPGPGSRRGPGMGPRGGQGIQNAPPVAQGQTEKEILAVLDEMDRNQRRGNMNVPAEDGRLLRILAEAITTNPDLETLILNHTGGISVTLKKRGLP